MSATAQASAYWAERHSSYGDPLGWLAHYWDDGDAAHRQQLRDDILTVHDRRRIRSVLEVGCNVGTNLRLVSEAIQGVQLQGCDVNAMAVTFAQEHLAGSFVHASALDYLGTVRAGSVDVAFTCYALAYLDPLDVPRALRGLLRVARRAIVIAEPMELGEEVASRRLNMIPEFRHPYAAIFRAMGVPRHRLRVREIAQADNLNAVLTLEVA